MANSSSSGKVTSNNETSPPNSSPHLAFTTISNIKLHIPVQLSLSEPNYKKWSRLFRLLILRFNLKGFIDGTTIASSADDAEWYQFDALIQGWMAIYNLFHDNKHAQAMQLEHRFRTTVKGQLSINEYCCLLNNLSEYLDDVDAPVTEHALVLQVLQGLPHDIRSQVQFLQFNFCNIKIHSRRSWKFGPPCSLLNNNKSTPYMASARRPQPACPPPAAVADMRATDTGRTRAAATANLGVAAEVALAAATAGAARPPAVVVEAETAAGVATGVKVVAAAETSGNPQAQIPGLFPPPPPGYLGHGPTSLTP
ncbi:unnamed protein product [Cuscuta campestris]|uniref:Retrotransposon Copia-like N-terminal domain-containing protein n=1 Tax=Cuscuta campestris TaxID=132261 RepID=A0A484L4Q2_9ASTE|nr:unnamed protein product [Cuscuta campestris]